MSKVLVVDDEESFVDALEVGLRREGFVVISAADGQEAMRRFNEDSPDIVLLDVMLPRLSGIDVCRQIRSISRVPIIMVSAKGSEIDTVVGLEVGADDYIAKPYRLHELVARMRAVLRRSEVATAAATAAAAAAAGEARPSERVTGNVLRVGGIEVDLDEHRVVADGVPVTLPLKEFQLLHQLIANAGRVMTRDMLLEKVWGYDFYGDTKTLDVHVKRLRARIESEPAHPTRIVTVRGVGYRFERG